MSHLPTYKRSTQRRGGLTLLEVILALAVLGISLAAIGEMIRIGVIGASIAKDETKAQMLCESKMNEVVLGVIPAQPIGPVSFDFEPEWVFTVSIIPIQQQELVSCTVLVEQVEIQGLRSHSFELTRWIAEPIVEEEEDVAETLLNSGGSPSTGSNSSESTGGGGGTSNTGDTGGATGGGGIPAGGGGVPGGGGTRPGGGDVPGGGEIPDGGGRPSGGAGGGGR
jgi:prepilin-type N-terminal cleavage/methylation domain-containing protein